MEARVLRGWWEVLLLEWGKVEELTRFVVRAEGVGENSGCETTRPEVRPAGRDLGVGLGMAERDGGEPGACSWWWEVRMEGICGREAGWVSVERR
jgi:hypothetical protein